mgnify:CR=1 FL=1
MNKRLYKYLGLTFLVGFFSAVFHGLGINNLLPRQIVYSDLIGFASKVLESIPYINKQIEYPPITGLFIHLMGKLSGGEVGYYILSSFFLILFGAATTYLFYKILLARPKLSEGGEEKAHNRLLWFWIFSPALLFFFNFNWDVIAIFFIVAAFYLESKKKNNSAAAFLALGFSAKIFPALFLVPLLIKTEKISEKIKALFSFLITTLAVNGYFIFANFTNWSYFLRLNSERNSNPDSIWTIIRFLFGEIPIPTINLISGLLLIVSLAFVFWKYREESFIKLSFAATLLFLIFNKVFTPQYVLWLLPFFVLLPELKKNWFYLLNISGIAVLFSILPWFFIEKSINYFYLTSIFVLIRHICLVYLLVYILKIEKVSEIKYGK